MSHFTCLVVGPNVEAQLLPFTANAKDLPHSVLTFVDTETKARVEYETESRDSFHCSSSSSWGQAVTAENFAIIDALAFNATAKLSVNRNTGGSLGGSYYKLGSFYHIGVQTNHKQPEKYLWIEVVKIVKTSSWYDPETCWNGEFIAKRVAEPVEVPLKEFYKTFEEMMEEWHGYDKGRDPEKGLYGYWTNPISKWDWFAVGGRWAGHILTKGKTFQAPNFSYGWDDSAKLERMDGKHSDYALKGEIDFEGMRSKAEKDAAETYDFVAPLIVGSPDHKPWKSFDYKKENARDEYHAQPRVVLWKALSEIHKGHPVFAGYDSSPDDFLISREKYIENAGNAAFRTFALLIDGKWASRGDMGWFGVVSDEQEEETWNKHFWDTINGLPDDTLLTVVDCHV